MSTGIWLKKHILMSESLIWPSTSNCLCYEKATWREWKSLLKYFFLLFQEPFGKRNYNHHSCILLFIFSFHCHVSQRKSMIRVTSQSQSISGIVATNKHQSLGFYWCLEIVQKNHTKIYMLACDHCWKSIEKTKPWIPSICFSIEYPDYNSKFVGVNII